MQKILVPFDGSESSLRALRHAAALVKQNPDVELELLHVIGPVPLKSHASLSQQEIEKMNADEAQAILTPARQLLDQEGVKYRTCWRSGVAADEIAAHVRETGCNALIMGTRGLGRVASLMVGSVALSVIHQVDVPVTLIK